MDRKNINFNENHYVHDIHEEPTAMDSDTFHFESVSVDPVLEKTEPDLETCWSQFLRGMRSIWATKQTEDTKSNRELYIKTTLRELVIYVLFLVVFMIIAFGMTTVSSYWFTNLLLQLFTNTQFNDNTGTFTTAASHSDFWKFLSGPLLNGLYWTTWYNSMNVSNNQINYIFYENKLIGVPRIRQVRVGNSSCVVPPDFKADILQCFAAYSPSTESSDPFGLSNGTAWTYTPPNVTQAGSYGGRIASYGAGGYYIDLNLTLPDSLNTLNLLFSNLWIDRGTRAVIVDFTVYNTNINMFCVVKLVGEFPATGGLITNYEFRTVKLIRYVGPIDFFVLTCELLFLLFIIYYGIEEFLEIRMLRLEYFFSIWNVLDLLVIVFSVICSVFNMYRTLTVQNTLQKLLSNDNLHQNFESLSYWQLQFNYLIAITLFISWIKIFKYISFNKTMTQLTATLDKCSTDLSGFAVMFFIIFLAFAQLGYLIFGAQVPDFSQLQTCIYTLFRIILGDFDFSQLETAHRILGPLYFVFYVFFVFFVLFNMFLAIIIDTYGEVKEELENVKNEFEISDYLRERTEMMLSKLHIKRDKIIDFQKATMGADANNDGKIDFDEWKTELKSRGYGEVEIETLFARYDTDGDRVIDEKEQKEMQRELELQKVALNSEISNEKSEHLKTEEEKSVSMEEYRALNRRVDRMDNGIKVIVNKIETVLEGLEAVEKTKSSSRETMGVILGTLSSSGDYSDEEKRRRVEMLIKNEINKLNPNSTSALNPKSTSDNIY